MPRKNYFYKYDLHDGAEDNDSWREENTATLIWIELNELSALPAVGEHFVVDFQHNCTYWHPIIQLTLRNLFHLLTYNKLFI